MNTSNLRPPAAKRRKMVVVSGTIVTSDENSSNFSRMSVSREFHKTTSYRVPITSGSQLNGSGVFHPPDNFDEDVLDTMTVDELDFMATQAVLQEETPIEEKNPETIPMKTVTNHAGRAIPDYVKKDLKRESSLQRSYSAGSDFKVEQRPRLNIEEQRTSLLNSLQENHNALKEECDRHNAKIETLNNMMISKDGEIRNLRDNFNRLQQQLSQLQKSEHESERKLKTEFDEKESTFKKEIDRLTTDVAFKEQEIVEIREKMLLIDQKMKANLQPSQSPGRFKSPARVNKSVVAEPVEAAKGDVEKWNTWKLSSEDGNDWEQCLEAIVMSALEPVRSMLLNPKQTRVYPELSLLQSRSTSPTVKLYYLFHELNVHLDWNEIFSSFESIRIEKAYFSAEILMNLVHKVPHLCLPFVPFDVNHSQPNTLWDNCFHLGFSSRLKEIGTCQAERLQLLCLDIINCFLQIRLPSSLINKLKSIDLIGQLVSSSILIAIRVAAIVAHVISIQGTIEEILSAKKDFLDSLFACIYEVAFQEKKTIEQNDYFELFKNFHSMVSKLVFNYENTASLLEMKFENDLELVETLVLILYRCMLFHEYCESNRWLPLIEDLVQLLSYLALNDLHFSTRHHKVQRFYIYAVTRLLKMWKKSQFSSIKLGSCLNTLYDFHVDGISWPIDDESTPKMVDSL